MQTRHLPARERRAVTVEAVLELAANQNPSDITTNAIARHMGVTQGALFRHFPDKMAIWTAVLEWTCGELNHRFDLLPDNQPLARLEAMLAAHVDFVIEQPGVPRILFGELQRAGDTPTKAIARQLMAGYRTRVARELHAAREAGDIAGDADVEAATVLFLAMVQGMVMQGLAVDDFTAMPVLARRLFGLFRQSLGASPCA